MLSGGFKIAENGVGGGVVSGDFTEGFSCTRVFECYQISPTDFPAYVQAREVFVGFLNRPVLPVRL